VSAGGTIDPAGEFPTNLPGPTGAACAVVYNPWRTIVKDGDNPEDSPRH
jgi:hypothetical protein